MLIVVEGMLCVNELAVLAVVFGCFLFNKSAHCSGTIKNLKM
jgi:hypothetical protein